MRLRTPIEAPNGRILKVGEYARYSTEEQNPRSIPDQFAYAEKVLAENNAPDYEKTQLSDAELSGELVSRPGIDQLRQGIARREWDLIIVEDSSRLYRHETECMVLAEEAVDEGIRVICINDFVDTAEPDWRERLHDAARHHARTNKYTSYRIKRSHESLWDLSAALTKCRPGYSRRASYPATPREPEQGPFFDSVDLSEAEIIKVAYEMVAAGDELALVADWLTKQGLRKCSGAKYSDYSVKNVIELIRRTIHRAFDTYRNKVSEKKLRTGKSRQRHRPEKVLTREMPHLRIVSDSLWYAANRMIDSRRRKTNVPSGDDHPLANIPRDSRFPLTKLFVCGICGHKMWSDGRNEGGYRCSGVRSGCCWNKATALRDCIHKKVSEAVANELLALDSTLDILVERISSILRQETNYNKQKKKLGEQVQQLAESCERLGEAIAKGSHNGQLETLLNLLTKKEQQLREAKFELAELNERATSKLEISPKAIRQQVDQTANKLLDLDRTSGLLLGRLIDGKILAVPCQQFGSNKIVLRAEFDFHPVGILPDQLRAALAGRKVELTPEDLPTKRIVLDLFEPSNAPKFALRAVELKEADPKLSLERLGKQLGISKHSAHISLQMGKVMKATGITDPFIRLTEKPNNPSRWRCPQNRVA